MSWFGNYLLEKEERDKDKISLHIPYFTIALMLFVTIVLANVVSTEISKSILARQTEAALKELSLEAKKATKKINSQFEEQARINAINRSIEQKALAKQNTQLRIQAERDANARRQRLETCRFWTQQYNKTGNAGDRSHMVKSCSDARNY